MNKPVCFGTAYALNPQYIAEACCNDCPYKHECGTKSRELIEKLKESDPWLKEQKKQ